MRKQGTEGRRELVLQRRLAATLVSRPGNRIAAVVKKAPVPE
jgi:hypothetical protein